MGGADGWNSARLLTRLTMDFAVTSETTSEDLPVFAIDLHQHKPRLAMERGW
jgi:hypothetical protein